MKGQSLNWLLAHEDAFEFLSRVKPETIDLIVSSPPYFMGKEYDTSLKVEDFIQIHERLAPILSQVLKPGGSLCWQVGSHVQNGVALPLDIPAYMAFSSDKSLYLRNRIIWTFGHGAHARNRFSGRYETILWFTKGDPYYFDLDAVRVPQKYPGKRSYKGPNKGKFSSHPLGKNPSDVWDIPNVKSNHIEKTGHPCQFPVALVQRLVRALSPAGGTVLDPFAGSASAGVAALLEGRRFVGCDVNAEYVRIGEERLRATDAGTVKYRSVDEPIFEPSGSMAVAKLPAHFSRLRSERFSSEDDATVA